MRSARRAATGPVLDSSAVAKHAAQELVPPARRVSYGTRLAVGAVTTALLSAGVVASADSRTAASAPVVAVPAASQTPLIGREARDEVVSRSEYRDPLEDLPSTREPIATETPAPAAAPEVPAAPVAPPAPVPPPAPAPAPAPPTATKYTTTTVNVRSEATSDSALAKQLPAGTQVIAVGPAADGWQRVAVNGLGGFISAQFLTDQAPVAEPTATPSQKASSSASAKPAPAPSSSSPSAAASTSAPAKVSGGFPACPNGTASGITAKAANVQRGICANFPSVTSFGGWRGDGEHADGRAIDAMVSGATGRAVANWARANAYSLGICTVIHAQQIWTQQRSGEGWRSMSDRGSATANHYDHVHIQVC